VITTISATAGSASVQGNQAYGPYGNTRYQAGNMGTAKGFTGQYQDATGLDYYNARYYDPVVSRFLSADTVQGNEEGMDPYAYVDGNPETKNDPSGHANDPYLIYILEWYIALHPGDQIFSELMIANPTNPNSRSGRSYPDIINRTLGIIWDAKTGGNLPFNLSFGTMFPSLSYILAGALRVRSAVQNANLMRFLGLDNWAAGTINSPAPAGSAYDARLANYFLHSPNCIVGICFARFQDGTILAILIPFLVYGIIAYKVLQGRTTRVADPRLILAPISAAILAWLLLQILSGGRQGPQPAPGFSLPPLNQQSCLQNTPGLCKKQTNPIIPGLNLPLLPVL
jgi:RHS repeat-associated protein